MMRWTVLVPVRFFVPIMTSFELWEESVKAYGDELMRVCMIATIVSLPLVQLTRRPFTDLIRNELKSYS